MGTDSGEENRSTGTRIINSALEKGVKEPPKSGAKKRLPTGPSTVGLNETFATKATSSKR